MEGGLFKKRGNFNDSGKQAKSVEDALELLSHYDNCKIIAGGTDIIIQMNEKKSSAKGINRYI